MTPDKGRTGRRKPAKPLSKEKLAEAKRREEELREYERRSKHENAKKKFAYEAEQALLSLPRNGTAHEEHQLGADADSLADSFRQRQADVLSHLRKRADSLGLSGSEADEILKGKLGNIGGS